MSESKEDRQIRRSAFWGGLFVCCLIVAAILASVDTRLPSGDYGQTPAESPSPAIPLDELQQIAEAFNSNPTESEEFFQDDEHLRGGTLIFATGATPESGNDASGWWYLCEFRAGGGVLAESCKALINKDTTTRAWKILSLIIDDKTYVR